MPLSIYPGGIKTRVAWHEVPGKKIIDASSPVGTVDQGFLQMCHCPFLGLADHVHLLLSLGLVSNQPSLRDGSNFILFPGTSCQAAFADYGAPDSQGFAQPPSAVAT